MNCMNCGAPVVSGLDYCGRCGWNLSVQRKAVHLSNLYYNRGLEKATIRDLSGAISCLKQSLKFYKGNIQARNLLGLVYFETGEVVSALTEWVISKNIRPEDNLADNYITKLRSNANKLENINQSIRKYNQALEYCRQGHEDMATIQLKRVLSQNPKLIKGYHLLALLQIHKDSFSKARRTLRKAAKIDKTNTTTLRFLQEVDLQTGSITNLDKEDRDMDMDADVSGFPQLSGNDLVIQPPTFRESSMWGILATLGIGIIIGIVSLWLLVVPDQTQKVQGSVNDEIQQYGSQLASKEAEINLLEEQLEDAQVSANSFLSQTDATAKKLEDYENLVQAASYFNQTNYTTAEEYLNKVTESNLSEEADILYQSLKSLLAEYASQAKQGNTQNQSGETGTLDGTSLDNTNLNNTGLDNTSLDGSSLDGMDVLTDDGLY